MRNHKALFVMFPFLLLLFSCQIDPAFQGSSPSVHVISVGMTYLFTRLPALNGTYEDAAEVACSLNEMSKKAEVTLLTDREGEKVTKDDLLDEIKGINASDEDLLVLYFSGHGSFDEKGCFLVLSSTDEDYSRLYMTELRDVLEDKGLKSLVLLDCCYAGEFSDLFDQKRFLSVFDCQSQSKVVAISSSSRSQTSLVSTVITQDGWGEYHSLFTIGLLKALGWIHSRSRKTDLNGQMVAGYLPHVQRNLDSTLLFEKLVHSWPLERQIPQISRTDLRLRIN